MNENSKIQTRKREMKFGSGTRVGAESSNEVRVSDSVISTKFLKSGVIRPYLKDIGNRHPTLTVFTYHMKLHLKTLKILK